MSSARLQMSLDTTENDELIARLLSEENRYQSNIPIRSRSSSPISSKKVKLDNVQQKSDRPELTQENHHRTQIDDDGEMALILQIEEIVLLENKINDKTVQVTDAQLAKTHADMTNALQPKEQTDAIVFGMFTTIQTRYTDCQAKNQVLIGQIQNLALQLYPTLIAFKTKGTIGRPSATVPVLAIGLITNVLQGNLEFNDAKQIMISMLQIWNGTNVWYEFIEQLVYILVAMTIPACATNAMGKVMSTISSSK